MRTKFQNVSLFKVRQFSETPWPGLWLHTYFLSKVDAENFAGVSQNWTVVPTVLFFKDGLYYQTNRSNSSVVQLGVPIPQMSRP